MTVGMPIILCDFLCQFVDFLRQLILTDQYFCNVFLHHIVYLSFVVYTVDFLPLSGIGSFLCKIKRSGALPSKRANARPGSAIRAVRLRAATA